MELWVIESLSFCTATFRKSLTKVTRPAGAPPLRTSILKRLRQMRLRARSAWVRRRHRSQSPGSCPRAGGGMPRWNRCLFRECRRSDLGSSVATPQPLRPGSGLAYHNGEIPQDETRISRTMIAVLRRSLLIRGFINTEFVSDHYLSRRGRARQGTSTAPAGLGLPGLGSCAPWADRTKILVNRNGWDEPSRQWAVATSRSTSSSRVP
jgi:hypothetical protein